MTFKITNYSCYEDFTFKAETKNISSIVNKLIQITAKVTEHYAGDIIYDVEYLRDCINDCVPYHKLLMFREMGINVIDYPEIDSNNCVVNEVDNEVLKSNSAEVIQYWELSYEPETTITVLERKNLVCINY